MTAPEAPPRSWRRILRRLALPPLLLIAASWLLVEEYLWARLEPGLRRVWALRPVARLEAVIAGLPPWAALLVFAGPAVLLFPIKLLALWVIAQGAWLTGIVIFALLKVIGAALGARIFLLTRPTLLKLRWFREAHDWFLGWRDRIHAWLEAQPAWQRVRRWRVWLRSMRGRMRPWALRQLLALRELLARRRVRGQG